MRNVYFDLTTEFNRKRPIAALASGQAVVYYRTAIMSKDGDWVIEENPEACALILEVLSKHGARYRPGAPLDIRWLAGGWSSHFEFEDEKKRRILDQPLAETHQSLVGLAERLLPVDPFQVGST